MQFVGHSVLLWIRISPYSLYYFFKITWIFARDCTSLTFLPSFTCLSGLVMLVHLTSFLSCLVAFWPVLGVCHSQMNPTNFEVHQHWFLSVIFKESCYGLLVFLCSNRCRLLHQLFICMSCLYVGGSNVPRNADLYLYGLWYGNVAVGYVACCLCMHVWNVVAHWNLSVMC